MGILRTIGKAMTAGIDGLANVRGNGQVTMNPVVVPGGHLA